MAQINTKNLHNTRFNSKLSVLLMVMMSFVSGVLSAQPSNSPQLLKPGSFSLEFIDVQETTQIVPPVTDDEGIIRIILDPSILKVFSANDVLDWIKNDQLQIRNIKFDRNNLSLRPDGSISFRFEFLFMPNTSRIDRHVQIRNVRDFNIYYQLHEFHQKRIVSYRLKIVEPPLYDSPKTGRVTFLSNIPEYDIEFVDPTNVVRRFNVPEKVKTLDMIPGLYRPIRITKSGFIDIEATQVVEADSLHIIEFDFRSLNTQNVTSIRPNTRRRWVLWTLGSIAAGSAAAYFLSTNQTPRLPFPPGPPN